MTHWPAAQFLTSGHSGLVTSIGNLNLFTSPSQPIGIWRIDCNSSCGKFTSYSPFVSILLIQRHIYIYVDGRGMEWICPQTKTTPGNLTVGRAARLLLFAIAISLECPTACLFRPASLACLAIDLFGTCHCTRFAGKCCSRIDFYMWLLADCHHLRHLSRSSPRTYWHYLRLSKI